jgi:hypothetical protein
MTNVEIAYARLTAAQDQYAALARDWSFARAAYLKSRSKKNGQRYADLDEACAVLLAQIGDLEDACNSAVRAEAEAENAQRDAEAAYREPTFL